MGKPAQFSSLLGKTLSDVSVTGDTVTFTTDWGSYRLFHEHGCLECVYVERIDGDISSLIGSPITMTEETTNQSDPAIKGAESYTWTFHKLATLNGCVTIRWFGYGCGCCPENVIFEEVACPAKPNPGTTHAL